MTDIRERLAKAVVNPDHLQAVLAKHGLTITETEAARVGEPMDYQMADLIAALDRRNIHSAGDLFAYEKTIARESIARGKPWSYLDE